MRRTSFPFFITSSSENTPATHFRVVALIYGIVFKEFSQKVIGCIMEVHGALGLVSRNILIRGLPTELKETGISVAVAFESAIRYKRDKTGLRRADSVLNKRYHGK